MKKLSFFLLILPLLSIICCESPILFTDSQPKDVKSRSAFESAYEGVYFCESDSSQVRIESGILFKEKTFSDRLTLAEIDSMPDLVWEGDQLYAPVFDQYLEILYRDEKEVFVNLTLRDTFFSVGPTQVLKYYKGYQILNRRLPNKNWDVSVLGQDLEGNITFFITKIPEDLEALEAITPVKDISTEDQQKFLLSPTKMEFKKLLKSKLIFEECDHFTRLGRKLQM